MAITKVMIWNFALNHIGNSRTVAENDGSREADSCALFWDAVEQTVMQDADWPFLTAYETLTKVADAPNYDWDYSYSLPAQSIKARRIVRSTIGKNDPNPPPFTLGVNPSTGARLLFTDEPPDIQLEYTYKPASPAAFYEAYPLYAMALSWCLARELAPSLAKLNGATKLADTQYAIALGRALAHAFSEYQRTLSQPESEFIRARD